MPRDVGKALPAAGVGRTSPAQPLREQARRVDVLTIPSIQITPREPPSQGGKAVYQARQFEDPKASASVPMTPPRLAENRVFLGLNVATLLV